jgi:hypothetical protein
MEKGCNGEGRIQGGIATVPGFGWWPIKAYRPCPAFLASGGRYRRQGQTMDEVASGGRYAFLSLFYSGSNSCMNQFPSLTQVIVHACHIVFGNCSSKYKFMTII